MLCSSSWLPFVVTRSTTASQQHRMCMELLCSSTHPHVLVQMRKSGASGALLLQTLHLAVQLNTACRPDSTLTASDAVLGSALAGSYTACTADNTFDAKRALPCQYWPALQRSESGCPLQAHQWSVRLRYESSLVCPDRAWCRKYATDLRTTRPATPASLVGIQHTIESCTPPSVNWFEVSRGWPEALPSFWFKQCRTSRSRLEYSRER
jgi:hypothetical protein